MNWILPGICNWVPEGPVAFYQIDRANRPAGLIQDQPRGLFTNFLIITILIKITACRRKIENKQTRIREWEENKQLYLDLVPLARWVLIQVRIVQRRSKTVKNESKASTFLTSYTPQTQWISEITNIKIQNDFLTVNILGDILSKKHQLIDELSRPKIFFSHPKLDEEHLRSFGPLGSGNKKEYSGESLMKHANVTKSIFCAIEYAPSTSPLHYSWYN